MIKSGYRGRVFVKPNIIVENRDYYSDCWKDRKPGRIGTIILEGGPGHGLYFQVLHEDGSRGFYNDDELEEVVV